MYVVCMYRFGGTSTRAYAYTRAQARGATPELRRVADTTHPTADGGFKMQRVGVGLVRCLAREEVEVGGSAGVYSCRYRYMLYMVMVCWLGNGVGMWALVYH